MPELHYRKMAITDVAYPGEISDVLLEQEDMWEDVNTENQVTLMTPIDMDGLKVSHLANFLVQWHRGHNVYNALSCNCQRFAYDLYEWMIGKHYASVVKELFPKLQFSAVCIRCEVVCDELCMYNTVNL